LIDLPPNGQLPVDFVTPIGLGSDAKAVCMVVVDGQSTVVYLALGDNGHGSNNRTLVHQEDLSEQKLAMQSQAGPGISSFIHIASTDD
jgi:hypothetical protein